MRGVSITSTTSWYQAFTNADLTAGVLTVTHSLGHKYCIVQVYDNNDDLIQPDDITLTDANNLDVDLTSYGTISGTWRVIVLDVGTTNSSVASDLSLSGQAAEDIAIFDGTNWVAKGGTEIRKVGNFTRDMTLAAGTQAITGLGFKPSTIIFFANTNDTPQASWGFTDSSGQQSFVADEHNAVANSYANATSDSIIAYQSGIIYYRGDVSSFDSDGFTVNWDKGGSPTGTLTVHYLAFR